MNVGLRSGFSVLTDPDNIPAALYAPPVSTFASLPPASAVPGQLRAASDLNNAVLRSDGTYWNPLNGSAVIANGSPNITLQNLTQSIMTTVAFPGGFIRAGSRIRTTIRTSLTGVGTGTRLTGIRMGAVGGGMSNGGAHQMVLSATQVPADLMGFVISTATAVNGLVRSSARSTLGLYTSIQSDNSAWQPTVNFASPWEIGFFGGSAAETARTAVTATWAAGVATFTSPAHGYATGDKIVNTTFTPTGYNGTLIVTGTTANTWTAAIASDPGGNGTGGTTSRISNVTLVDYLVEWLQ